jgi:hypothetical protein
MTGLRVRRRAVTGSNDVRQDFNTEITEADQVVVGRGSTVGALSRTCVFSN